MNKSNLSIILGIINLILIAYILWSKPSNTPAPYVHSAHSDTTGKNFTGNLVYIHLDSLNTNFKMVTDYNKTLKEEKQRMENSIQSRVKSLEEQILIFREQAPTLTMEEGQKKQLSLASEEQKIMELEESLSGKYLSMEKEKHAEMQSFIQNFLSHYADSLGINYVFGYNGLGNILYAKPGKEITQEALLQLNQAYLRKKQP